MKNGITKVMFRFLKALDGFQNFENLLDWANSLLQAIISVIG